MTSSRWLLTGAMLGFLASSVSCGEEKTCDASSCPTGCCSADNECVTNTTAQQCGFFGAACGACGFGQVCSQGQCTTPGVQGGGVGSTGGGSGATGGGTGTNTTCTQLTTAETTFFAGATVCEYDFDGGSASISTSESAVPRCNILMTNAACTTADRARMTTYVSCLQAAPACTAGNEQSAVTSAFSCSQTLYSGLSQACVTALSSPTGGGSGSTGGGVGSTGGGVGSTGGGDGSLGGGVGSLGGGVGSLGGGVGSLGGGVGSLGGGDGSVGGGDGSVGGGVGSVGGGVGSVGGGVGTTGGGVGSVGGGVGTTGGGVGTTGGGSGNPCADAAAYQTTFFAGRSSCPSSSGTLYPVTDLQSICLGVCNTSDQSLLAAMGSCSSSVACTTGNELAAFNQFSSCSSDSFPSLSTSCRNAIIAGSMGGGSGTTGGGTGSTGGGVGTTGGGVGTTGGGVGTTGGGTGTTGGGTGSCTTINIGTFAQGVTQGGQTVYPAEPIGTSLGDSSLIDFAQLRFTTGTTGSSTFSTSSLNFATCDRCLFIGEDAVAGGGPARVYAAASGTINVTGSSPLTGPLTATLSNVTLREGTFDGTGNFTQTSGGLCLTVSSASISAAGPPTGTWTCDQTWFGDGSCDCGCGVQDSDCASTTNQNECEYCIACGGPGSGSSPAICAPLINDTNTTLCQ